jgi:hypothetical protein
MHVYAPFYYEFQICIRYVFNPPPKHVYNKGKGTRNRLESPEGVGEV